MNDISFLLNTLNGREKAVLVWFVVFIIWVLFQKNIRKSLLGVLKSFFQIKILSVFVAMFAYIFFILWLFYNFQIWNNVELTKDIVFWIFGSAIILLMNTTKATQDDNYFKNILRDNLKLIVMLEFVIVLYSFNFWIEMIFVPVMFFIVATGAMAETKKEYSQVKKIIDFALFVIGISLMVFAIFQITSDYQNFLSINNLLSFVLPPLFSFALIPFLYIFALIMAYETLFVRLDIFLKNNKALAKFAKIKIFKLCFLNLKKLNKFAKESSTDLLNVKDKNDILSLVHKFAK